MALGLCSLVTSCITLPFAFWLPMLTSSKFIFSKHTFSLLTGLGDLYNGKEYALFILILLFCVITPILKLLILIKFWAQRNSNNMPRALDWISKIGKWSMIDVYMCAVLFVTLKLGYTVSITIHAGIYYFATAILSSMIATECAQQWAKFQPRCSTPDSGSEDISQGITK